jgi:amino acid transporter
MSSAVIAINVAYGLPFFCRIVWTRNVPLNGPFSLGKASIPVNLIALVWIAFFAVILCFPSLSPVDAASMNYASLMIGAVVVFALGFWFVNGRYHYKGPLQNVHE